MLGPTPCLLLRYIQLKIPFRLISIRSCRTSSLPRELGVCTRGSLQESYASSRMFHLHFGITLSSSCKIWHEPARNLPDSYQ